MKGALATRQPHARSRSLHAALRNLCRVELHRIETRFGPVDVRVYRLREGWWPVALGGRDQLPAYPVVEDAALPRSAEDAVHRLASVIDAMTADALA
jgi:hypothetical protein